ncbi:hypothetical protein Zmor_028450 [Zophobas morio]|uniref:DDE Tnp4 domain-containing protein n=1 Tax=Zophobas morio TaxID=2755281 RepID=A0AA38HSR6_9CUCU|nr:hypothetical protein Zmor_028450 [Zophobas morio]
MANLNEFLIQNVIENVERGENQQRVRIEAVDPFDLSDFRFIKLFRLRKEDVEDIEELIEPLLNQRQRLTGLTTRTKLLAALRFFAGGSYQLDVGGNYTVGLSQPSVSRAIHEIIDAFNTPFMLNRFIKFPQTIEELTNIRQRFFYKFGLPGIIGCIDGTHVSIVTPIENEHLYINRKRYHSLNVQIICDEQLKITNVNARFPGSTHDSFVWQNSNIFTFLRDLPREHRGSYYLLGDSGYPLRAWMMTPILPEPPAGSPEANYNARIRTIRSSVEMCHGKLKNRFRCLLKDRTLHYSPVTAGQIVNSCAVLHNICIGNNVPLYEDEIVVEEMDNQNYEENPREENFQNDLAEGRRIRQVLIRNYCNHNNDNN